MSPVVAALRELSSAEDIFGYFDVPFDTRVVNVNRLHILKRFQQYLREAGGLDTLESGAAREAGRSLLARAYADFVHSSAIEQKVFKVFHMGAGKTQHITLDSLRASARAH